MIETVRLVLQPGLVDAAVRDDLWRKAARRNAYYVGFMAALPDALPGGASAHPLAAALAAPLAEVAADPPAALLARALSPAGQAYLDTARHVLDKPTNQDVVNSLFYVIACYFSPLRPEGVPDATMQALEAEAAAFAAAPEGALGRLIGQVPGLRDLVRSMRVLSGLSYGVVRPVFGDSTAIGSLMRRKLEPLFAPLRGHIDLLRGGRR